MHLTSICTRAGFVDLGFGLTGCLSCSGCLCRSPGAAPTTWPDRPWLTPSTTPSATPTCSALNPHSGIPQPTHSQQPLARTVMSNPTAQPSVESQTPTGSSTTTHAMEAHVFRRRAGLVAGVGILLMARVRVRHHGRCRLRTVPIHRLDDHVPRRVPSRSVARRAQWQASRAGPVTCQVRQ